MIRIARPEGFINRERSGVEQNEKTGIPPPESWGNEEGNHDNQHQERHRPEPERRALNFLQRRVSGEQGHCSGDHTKQPDRSRTPMNLAARRRIILTGETNPTLPEPSFGVDHPPSGIKRGRGKHRDSLPISEGSRSGSNRGIACLNPRGCLDKREPRDDIASNQPNGQGDQKKIEPFFECG